MYTPVPEFEADFSTAQPTYNFARPNGFRLVILNLPGVEFNCQMASIPEFSSNETPRIKTPLNDFPVVGTESTFAPLEVAFIVDEQLENYKQVYNWMKGIYFPQTHEQFADQIRKYKSLVPSSSPYNTESKLISDIHLMILDSNNATIATVKFIGAFPTSVGSLPLSITQSSDFQYLTATASFSYAYYVLA